MPGAFPVPDAPPLPFRPIVVTLSKETMRFDKDSLSGSIQLCPNGMMGTFEVLKREREFLFQSGLILQNANLQNGIAMH